MNTKQKQLRGERALVNLLEGLGYPAYRASYTQANRNHTQADVEGTPFFAENKEEAGLPVRIWRIVEQCLERRKKSDRRPILIRIKKTGRKYPPLLVMLQDEWVAREKSGSRSRTPRTSTPPDMRSPVVRKKRSRGTRSLSSALSEPEQATRP